MVTRAIGITQPMLAVFFNVNPMNALADNAHSRAYVLAQTRKDEVMSVPVLGFEGG